MIYTKIINEDYFDELELTDDDIQSQSNNEQYKETDINEYPFYMIMQILSKDSYISLSKADIKKFSKQCYYILNNMPDTTRVSKPIYYDYYFEQEYGSDIESISIHEKDGRVCVVFGLDAHFFNFNHFWVLMIFLFNYKNIEVYRVIFNDELSVDIHSNATYFDYWNFHHGCNSSSFEGLINMLNFLKVKYDYEELCQRFYQPIQKLFKNYVQKTGKKLTIIEGGDIKPSMIKNNLHNKLCYVTAINSIDLEINEICHTCNDFTECDINDNIKQHINDDSNGNIAKCSYVILSRQHNIYSSKFIIYFTRTCQFFKKNSSDKYPHHYIITIEFPVSYFGDLKTFAYILHTFETFGIDSDKFLNDIFANLPVKLLRNDYIKQNIKDKIQLLRDGKELL